MKAPILIICICMITVSCAPPPESAKTVRIDQGNHIAIGLYHGAISPFALVGKAIGLHIGVYDAGMRGISYWIGYLIAVSFLIRTTLPVIFIVIKELLKRYFPYRLK